MGKQTSSSQRSAKIITEYNQIDYILCSGKIKHTLINARSFSGTETSSDHRLVICKMQVEKHNIFKDASKTHSKSYNTFQLIKSEETKNVYQKQLHKNVMYCMSKYPSQYHRCSKKNNWSHQK